MDFKFLLILSVLVVSSVLIEGRRPHGSRRTGGRQRTQSARYTWTRNLAHNANAQEDALVPVGTRQIILKSTDESLILAGFNRSKTIYDFNSTTPIVVVTLENGRRGGPCYLLSTTLTYESAIALLTARNNSVAVLGTQVDFDRTSASLSKAESRTLISGNPILRGTCKAGKIFTSGSSPNVTGGTTTTAVLRVLNLDTIVRLTVAAPTATARTNRRGQGRGHRRG